MRIFKYKGDLIAVQLFSYHFYRDDEAKDLLKIFVENPNVDPRCSCVSIKSYIPLFLR